MEPNRVRAPGQFRPNIEIDALVEPPIPVYADDAVSQIEDERQ